MVGDNHVEAVRAGVGHLAHVADAAVDGDQQAHALGRELVDRVGVEAIALAQPVRDIGPDLAAHRLDRLHQQRDCRDSIGIEIAVDHDRLALGDRRRNTAGRGIHTAHQERIVQATLVVGREKRRDVARVVQTALVEQRGDERRAIAQRGDEFGGSWIAQNPALLASGHAAPL